MIRLAAEKKATRFTIETVQKNCDRRMYLDNSRTEIQSQQFRIRASFFLFD